MIPCNGSIRARSHHSIDQNHVVVEIERCGGFIRFLQRTLWYGDGRLKFTFDRTWIHSARYTFSIPSRYCKRRHYRFFSFNIFFRNSTWKQWSTWLGLLLIEHAIPCYKKRKKSQTIVRWCISRYLLWKLQPSRVTGYSNLENVNIHTRPPPLPSPPFLSPQSQGEEPPCPRSGGHVCSGALYVRYGKNFGGACRCMTVVVL